jgi:hypothetical protein
VALGRLFSWDGATSSLLGAALFGGCVGAASKTGAVALFGVGAAA